MSFDDSQVGVQFARRMVAEASRIVILTGAGISTDSGIPDFRGPQGVWTKNPAAEKMATLQNYLAEADVRRASWASRAFSPIWDAQPNDGHRALVRLEERGSLHTLVTQNVDGLHQSAGSDPSRIVEIHGTSRFAICWTCRLRSPMQVFLERVRAGEEDPGCEVCGGIVKSDTISFGQNLVPEDLDRAMDAARGCDLLLAVGTSLAVYPIAGMVPLAVRAQSPVVIVNGQATEMDHLATAVLRGAISDLLPRLVDPVGE